MSEEFQNGQGFGYIVAFRPNGTRGWKEKMVTSSDASKFIYRDESVPPLTPFEVKVGVYNNKGDGPFSPIVVICSAEGGQFNMKLTCILWTILSYFYVMCSVILCFFNLQFQNSLKKCYVTLSMLCREGDELICQGSPENKWERLGKDIKPHQS